MKKIPVNIIGQGMVTVSVPDDASDEVIEKAVQAVQRQRQFEKNEQYLQKYPGPKEPEGSGLSRFLGGAWDATKGLVKGSVMSAIGGPVSVLVNAVQPQVNEITKARQTTGWERFGHGAAAAFPIFGPMAADLGEQLGSGDFAGAAGKATVYAGLNKLGQSPKGRLAAPKVAVATVGPRVRGIVPDFVNAVRENPPTLQRSGLGGMVGGAAGAISTLASGQPHPSYTPILAGMSIGAGAEAGLEALGTGLKGVAKGFGRRPWVDPWANRVLNGPASPEWAGANTPYVRAAPEDFSTLNYEEPAIQSRPESIAGIWPRETNTPINVYMAEQRGLPPASSNVPRGLGGAIQMTETGQAVRPDQFTFPYGTAPEPTIQMQLPPYKQLPWPDAGPARPMPPAGTSAIEAQLTNIPPYPLLTEGGNLIRTQGAIPMEGGPPSSITQIRPQVQQSPVQQPVIQPQQQPVIQPSNLGQQMQNVMSKISPKGGPIKPPYKRPEPPGPPPDTNSPLTAKAEDLVKHGWGDVERSKIPHNWREIPGPAIKDILRAQAKEVLEEKAKPRSEAVKATDALKQSITDMIGRRGSMSIGKIAEATGLTKDQVSSVMQELKTKGAVEQDGVYWRKVSANTVPKPEPKVEPAKSESKVEPAKKEPEPAEKELITTPVKNAFIELKPPSDVKGEPVKLSSKEEKITGNAEQDLLNTIEMIGQHHTVHPSLSARLAAQLGMKTTEVIGILKLKGFDAQSHFPERTSKKYGFSPKGTTWVSEMEKFLKSQNK